MPSATHERWLAELTVLPTAAGREDRVVAWIEGWVAARKNLQLRRDRSGNLVITRRQRPRGRRPLFITAHLDHPAFVVRRVLDARAVELEFRGGVHDPYFDNAKVEIFDAHDRVHRATIASLDAAAKPFKRVVAALSRPADTLAPGDVGRWRFTGLPRVRDGRLHTNACDDLAAVAAALAALDELRKSTATAHVGVLFTRAEEVGFIGTLAACRDRTVPKSSRLLCLENSRSFAESPIGAGPILRVGDRMSVFDPALTNRIGDVLAQHQARRPSFTWQRRLMPGGACEATAFSTYGYESTCLCLPLGNYHNMRNIDGVLSGKRPARVGPEFIALSDYHGLIEMLVIVARQLDSAKVPPMRDRFDKILRERGFVLESRS